MAKLLYLLKMYFLSQKIILELPKDAVFFQPTREDKAFCQVCCFLLCPLVAKSTWTTALNNDLLLNTLLGYNSKDATCGSIAIKALILHMWYHTKELVSLALFSSCINPCTKQRIVDKLKTLPKKKFCSK